MMFAPIDAQTFPLSPAKAIYGTVMVIGRAISFCVFGTAFDSIHCSRTNAENVSPPFYHVNRILYSNISIIISGSSYNGSGCRGLWPPLLYCNSLMAHCYIYWERKSTIENSPVSGIVQLCYSPLFIHLLQ